MAGKLRSTVTTVAVRKAKRNGHNVYGKNVAEEIDKRIPLDTDEMRWLTDWVNYFRLWPQIVASGKYRSGTDILAALGKPSFAGGGVPKAPLTVRHPVPMPSEPENPEAEIDTMFERPDQQSTIADTQVAAKANIAGQEVAAKAGSDIFEEAVSSASDDPPPPVLPKPDREIPFKFMSLQADNGKTFCRVYWKSDDIGEIRDKASLLAGDKAAVDEINNLGAPARAFLIETMSKLGIPLP